jgi:hypothetical protein
MNPAQKLWTVVLAFFATLQVKANALVLKMLAQRAAILAKDTRGKVDLVDVILLGIGIFLISYLIPLGITAAINANTTGWDPTVKTLWTVLWPVMAVLFAIIYMVYSIKHD